MPRLLVVRENDAHIGEPRENVPKEILRALDAYRSYDDAATAAGFVSETRRKALRNALRPLFLLARDGAGQALISYDTLIWLARKEGVTATRTGDPERFVCAGDMCHSASVLVVAYNGSKEAAVQAQMLEFWMANARSMLTE